MDNTTRECGLQSGHIRLKNVGLCQLIICVFCMFKVRVCN